jgi:hypothetical protein
MSAAKIKTSTSTTRIKKPKVKRPGIHAKSKTSSSKRSKNYVKLYTAQGK